MSKTVKERPILFSGPMVRAILNGTKTQTRRVVDFLKPTADEMYAQHVERHQDKSCKYGTTGDRLWVREAWAAEDVSNPAFIGLQYRATPMPKCRGREVLRPDGFALKNPVHGGIGNEDGQWRPSIFMPRWASRLTLEITGIRVERLQDISVDDAFAEGYQEERCSTCRGSGTHPYGDPCRCGDGYAENQIPPQMWYRYLWESLHGEESWEANPWVWVIEFKKLEATDGN